MLAQSNDRGGQAPALRAAKILPLHRRARACPSPVLASSNDCGGNPLGCACGIRGPPRYGKKACPRLRRARACPSPCVWLADCITLVVQDRLKLWHICQAILNRSGAGAPELQSYETPSVYCIETGRSLLPGCMETRGAYRQIP